MPLVVVMVVVCLSVVVLSASQDVKFRRLEGRFTRLQHSLDALTDHFGLATGLDEVDTLLRDGKKMQAIKVYRERTGTDLREAKHFVDRRSGEGSR